ncbi:SCO4225 family membrane protein [Streptomyces sp. NPDC093591]|uniref:SCO4225 family membrane protein n=1 Tax=Streptomyces sp. NPDC093591 TaxID=3366044 RepID=UPI003818B130
MTSADHDSVKSDFRRVRDHLGVVGLVYLAVCLVLLVWALMTTAGDSSGESMAGVIPLLATAPASLVYLVLPENTVMFISAVAFGAEVNAEIIGWCTRALRRGRRPDPAS